ncbi:MAG: leucine-rich repeat protein [Clostridia bacterium]|nr:leucine-rich repeat protein [Clostridia bacterium]
MKRNFKKICSLILCVAAVFSLYATQAYAATNNGSCGENLTWTFDTDTGILEIGGTGKMKDWSVSSTKPWDQYKSDIRTVIINSGVTSIGSYAFGYFKSISKITIPDTVTVIGSSAFKYCTAVYEFNIPDSITSIGNEAFYGCKIKNINLPEKLTDMGYRVFTFCDALESIVLPEKLQTIGMYAFSYCTALKKAEIKGNTSFGDGIFYGCSALEYIHISVKTKNISNNAFLNTTAYICAAEKGCDAETFANNNGHEFRLCNNHENIVRVRGDVDGNGQCDGQDAFLTDLIVKGILSANDIGEAGYKAADCNLDGVINDLDVELLIKAGLMLIEIEQYETDITTNSKAEKVPQIKYRLIDIITEILTYIINLLR